MKQQWGETRAGRINHTGGTKSVRVRVVEISQNIIRLYKRKGGLMAAQCARQ